jgi:DNA-3-methyladenine glycosylase
MVLPLMSPRALVMSFLEKVPRTASNTGVMSGYTAYTASLNRAMNRSMLADVVGAAQALLGCMLVREQRGRRRAGIIVETEAYPHDDPACHAFRGVDARNGAMFSVAGRAYVYRIHRSLCFNIVTGPEGRGEAVLVRAVEPVDGIDIMRRARQRATVGRRSPDGTALTNGPGKLCQAFGIDLRFDGTDLLMPPLSNGLYLLYRAAKPDIAVSTRIGISQARHAPLRFFIPGNAWVSR